MAGGRADGRTRCGYGVGGHLTACCWSLGAPVCASCIWTIWSRRVHWSEVWRGIHNLQQVSRPQAHKQSHSHTFLYLARQKALVSTHFQPMVRHGMVPRATWTTFITPIASLCPSLQPYLILRCGLAHCSSRQELPIAHLRLLRCRGCLGRRRGCSRRSRTNIPLLDINCSEELPQPSCFTAMAHIHRHW